MTEPTRAPQPVRTGDRTGDEALPPVDEELVQRRAELNAEEREAGSEDPVGQARAILEESEARVADPAAVPDELVEHRTSDETVEPLEQS
jgi:hypothetical protein